MVAHHLSMPRDDNTRLQEMGSCAFRTWMAEVTVCSKACKACAARARASGTSFACDIVCTRASTHCADVCGVSSCCCCCCGGSASECSSAAAGDTAADAAALSPSPVARRKEGCELQQTKIYTCNRCQQSAEYLCRHIHVSTTPTECAAWRRDCWGCCGPGCGLLLRHCLCWVGLCAELQLPQPLDGGIDVAATVRQHLGYGLQRSDHTRVSDSIGLVETMQTCSHDMLRKVMNYIDAAMKGRSSPAHSWLERGFAVLQELSPQLHT